MHARAAAASQDDCNENVLHDAGSSLAINEREQATVMIIKGKRACTCGRRRDIGFWQRLSGCVRAGHVAHLRGGTISRQRWVQHLVFIPALRAAHTSAAAHGALADTQEGANRARCATHLPF
jgi:hypothetical protein